MQGQFGQRERDGVYLPGGAKRSERHRKIEHKVIRVIPRCQRLVLTHLVLQLLPGPGVKVGNAFVENPASGLAGDVREVGEVRTVGKSILHRRGA